MQILWTFDEKFRHILFHIYPKFVKKIAVDNQSCKFDTKFTQNLRQNCKKIEKTMRNKDSLAICSVEARADGSLRLWEPHFWHWPRVRRQTRTRSETRRDSEAESEPALSPWLGRALRLMISTVKVRPGRRGGPGSAAAAGTASLVQVQVVVAAPALHTGTVNWPGGPQRDSCPANIWAPGTQASH